MSLKKIILISALSLGGLTLAGCGSDDSGGITPQIMADNLYAVMEADRTVYAKLIVNRLQNIEGRIKASEHWKDDKALVLPAQMFRYASERVAKKGRNFSYSLISLWPVNKKNAPRTDMEKRGLEFIQANPDKNFYGTEVLGGKTYFTAIYPDVAVAPACIKCHNRHKDSPRTDFKIGDTMGGVIIRILTKE